MTQSSLTIPGLEQIDTAARTKTFMEAKKEVLTVQGVTPCSEYRTMACKAVRGRVGVDAGSFIKIRHEEQDRTIIRRLAKVRRELLAYDDDGRTLFMDPSDMRLMGINSGDSVEVELSDFQMEVP